MHRKPCLLVREAPDPTSSKDFDDAVENTFTQRLRNLDMTEFFSKKRFQSTNALINCII